MWTIEENILKIKTETQSLVRAGGSVETVLVSDPDAAFEWTGRLAKGQREHGTPHLSRKYK